MFGMSAWKCKWLARAAGASLVMGLCAAMYGGLTERSGDARAARDRAQHSAEKQIRIASLRMRDVSNMLAAASNRWSQGRARWPGSLDSKMAEEFLRQEGSGADGSGFSMADARGWVVADYPKMPGRSGQSVDSRGYFQQAIRDGSFAVEAPIFSKSRNAFIGVAAYPVRGKDGEIEGAILATIRLDGGALIDALSAEAQADGVSVSWTGSKGRPIWSNLEPKGNGDFALAEASLEYPRWRVVAQAPIAASHGALLRAAFGFMGAFLSSMGLAIVAAWAFAGDLNPRLRRLRKLDQGEEFKAELFGLGAVEESLARVEQALGEKKRASEEFDAIFEGMGQATGMGIFTCDAQGKILRRNGKFNAMSSAAPTVSALAMGRDRDELLGHFTAVTQGVGKVRWEGWAGDSEHQSRWAVCMLPLCEGAEGRYLGAVQDVSEKSRLEMRLIFERDKAERMMEAINEAVLYLDTYGHIERASAGMLDVLGLNSSDIRGLWVGAALELMGTDERGPACLEQMLLVDKVDSDQWAIRRRDGSVIPVELRWRKMREESMEGVLSLVDISARVREIEKMRWEANHDALTGLLNRRAFAASIEELQGGIIAEGDQCAIVLLDLDGFKEVNDSFGHEVGDEILKMAARALAGLCRQGDAVGRLGGDEFVVAMRGCSLEMARERSLAMREAICSISAERDGSVASVGVSIGVSMLGAFDAKGKQALREADQAMYMFKKQGKMG